MIILSSFTSTSPRLGELVSHDLALDYCNCSFIGDLARQNIFLKNSKSYCWYEKDTEDVAPTDYVGPLRVTAFSRVSSIAISCQHDGLGACSLLNMGKPEDEKVNH
ncbi:predicted protein [Sclerotinia sclerotiorum 1980 UF-70]|uniref:Uncharacterized protein n=1 Tax=Sclerotinia sclerotiorum (strain ATCC 18683 / 1980 / Ss-1) TaxID=665079 RepID=A7ECU8_SCLS1|nr:predicted protein [Sclerotinia sclerotiorum 1980 UF-70]EDO00664.1 predicted protein [Sclerotinia sclerotiorum 1980 UF-70]